jgi:hypothetical protein
MSDSISEGLPWAPITNQPDDVRGLSDSECDKLIIAAIRVDRQWVILSCYGDDTWQLDGLPSNVPSNKRQINFGIIPLPFRAVMKAILYRYMRRGRISAVRPKGATIRLLFDFALPFLQHLEKRRVERLGAVTPMIAATYVAACKAHGHARTRKPLAIGTLRGRFFAVEALYELSHYTGDQMQHPWPDTTAQEMAGAMGMLKGGRTPLIPDDTFCTLFEHAYQQMECGKLLLDLRDDWDAIESGCKHLTASGIDWKKNRFLADAGWKGNLATFNKSLSTLRTACYIVLASTSGCRNHELANLQSGAHHRTEDDNGIIYHWMRSESEKTDEGIHDWMVPEVAVRALRIMERWSAPYQALIADEIIQRRRINPLDPKIAEAYQHRHALFLGMNLLENNQVRTLSNGSWCRKLNEFAKDCGLTWALGSHQFRRKFANYAAHSRFGDLRYLKEHYAHWSLDMTLGYAMDDSWGQHLELDLYMEIQGELEDIKLGVVDNWIEDEYLAGGYGHTIKGWQREPENLLIFKDHYSMLKSISESTAIRSNGHAWCTADNDGCVGNTLERSRCTGCDHSVIGSTHAPFYQRLYYELKELIHCKDIGEGGRQRVERDLNRCRDVLIQLGMDPEVLIV